VLRTLRAGFLLLLRQCFPPTRYFIPVSDPRHPLIDVFSLHDLPMEGRLRLAEELAQILEVRVLSDAYETLTEAQGAELDQLLNGDRPELVSMYLQRHVPSLQSIYQRAVETLKQELAEHRRAAEAAAREGC
jgi:hypothetical protein